MRLLLLLDLLYVGARPKPEPAPAEFDGLGPLNFSVAKPTLNRGCRNSDFFRKQLGKAPAGTELRRLSRLR